MASLQVWEQGHVENLGWNSAAEGLRGRELDPRHSRLGWESGSDETLQEPQCARTEEPPALLACLKDGAGLPYRALCSRELSCACRVPGDVSWSQLEAVVRGLSCLVRQVRQLHIGQTSSLNPHSAIL